MSTTWTSTITNTSDIIDNDVIGSGSTGTGSDSGSTTPVESFNGIMNTNEPLFFGTASDYSISHNSSTGSLEFDVLQSENLSNTSVLFNFADGSNDLLKIYKSGTIAIKNLTQDPSESDTNSYQDGSLIMVNGDLKILDSGN